MNILITGGASGLGQAITLKLVSEPENTVIFSFNKSSETASQIESKFPNSKGILCRFSSSTDIIKLQDAVEEYGIDVLINNATAGFQTNYFHKLSVGYFKDNFELNILPVVQITQAAIKYFRKKKSGKIITILSEAIVNKPPMGWSEYAAGKAYLLSLSKSWAAENAAFNITSNCISPSFMETPLTKEIDERIVSDMISKHPLRQLLKVEEVANVVSFFVGASTQINGTNFIINAGQNVI